MAEATKDVEMQFPTSFEVLGLLNNNVMKWIKKSDELLSLKQINGTCTYLFEDLLLSESCTHIHHSRILSIILNMSNWVIVSKSECSFICFDG